MAKNLKDPKPATSPKNDDAWQRVCAETNLLEEIKVNGYFYLSSKTLTQIREARLMVKFDFKEQRPSMFREHRLNILPLKRGNYVIFPDPKNVCYYTFKNDGYETHEPKPYWPKVNLTQLDTLTKELCTTESDALELAALSSLLSTFCKTSNLKLTTRGRRGSSTFNIQLPVGKAQIEVASSQIEVDGIYESDDTVALVEAKMYFHKDFHKRQLFYPFRWLKEKTKKRIVPLLLCYSGGVYQLTEFEIGDQLENFKLIRQEYFVIQSEQQTQPHNLEVFARYKPTPKEDFGTPFPQADDMDKVIDIVRLAQRGVNGKDKLVELLGFVERQADYYTAAARYLGFTDKDGNLTAIGIDLMKRRFRLDRTELIVARMLDRPALRQAIKLLIVKGYDPKKVLLADLEELIREARPGEYADDTYARRARTVRNWLGWLVANWDVSK